MVKILFVCLGNICRSPAAEGVFRNLITLQKTKIPIDIASCGLGDWHVGQLADHRMRSAALDRNIVLAGRAQKFTDDFFEKYDYIFAADQEVMNELYQLAKTAGHKAKVHLMTAYSKSYKDHEIPDPYFGSESDFNLVLDMLQDACEGIYLEINSKHSH